jgi:hypothetical protein
MTFGKRVTTPFKRSDAAFMLSCGFWALLLTVCAVAVPAIYDSEDHLGQMATFTDDGQGHTSETHGTFVVPRYSHEIVVQTTADPKPILQALNPFETDDRQTQIQVHSIPRFRPSWSDYLATFVGGLIGLMFVGLLLQITQKIASRILGVESNDRI